MADDHSNPPSLGYVRLGPKPTVHEMAIAAASRHSGIPSQRAQYDITVRDIGGDIVDGLPAFYHAADGSLTPLTSDHDYWSQLVAYLAGKTTRTEVHAGRSWLDDRPSFHQKKVAINRDWIGQVIIQKMDYAVYLRSRSEPLPEWWFASIKADRAHSYSDTAEAGSVDLRKHNKRETEARYRQWQERIDKLAQDSPGKSHTDYCRRLAKEIGNHFQTIRRNTRFPHS